MSGRGRLSSAEWCQWIDGLETSFASELTAPRQEVVTVFLTHSTPSLTLIVGGPEKTPNRGVLHIEPDMRINAAC